MTARSADPPGRGADRAVPAEPPRGAGRARPEILAPAGDEESLAAALAAGADAVYFGLADGFNARARAGNFPLASLPQVVERLHRAGARGYLTLNTLVFEPELERVESILREVARAGVDAILVQDPAVALLAREVAPGVEVHASTQMTVSSPEGVQFACDLGMTRVVAPRELSLEELSILIRNSPLEVEVFIHGALCVSWSGQCLTSEAWGGRSANRGQCAQSCRLPYDLVVDGEVRDLGETAYLLSPRDLAGWRHVPELLRLGVASLKIEGRQKGATYVATAVQAYRAARDRAGDGALLDPGQVEAMATSFSRGFSSGFFAGSDHQTLVDGRFPKHRGLLVGLVTAVRDHEVTLASTLPGPALRPGDGVVFDGGRPEAEEPGGPIHETIDHPDGSRVLRFGSPGPDLSRVAPGQRVWKTSDAQVSGDVRRLLRAGDPRVRSPLHMEVSGSRGGALVVVARGPDGEVVARSTSTLTEARGGGLDATILEAKLGRLGETRWELTSLGRDGLEPGLHLPVRELNEVRRALVDRLDAVAAPAAAVPEEAPAGALARLYSRLTAGAPAGAAAGAPRLLALCRTMDQLDAVIASGLSEVELDWMELVGLERAVDRARGAGLHVRIATLRVQKPGEAGYDTRMERLAPDSLLVRHWGALEYFRRGGGAGGAPPELHGDFSLNVANALTARYLLERGLATITPAHDLDAAQLFAMAERLDPGRITIPLHHHMPTFHTEHCVYAHLLSQGRDFRTCGRPCEERSVSLRDRTGQEHPVIVDVGCRNTVFNAKAQSAASLVPRFLAVGFRRFRVEFVRETGAEAGEVLETYRGLLAGTLTAAMSLSRVRAMERFGVTGGTLLNPVPPHNPASENTGSQTRR